jgi:hypothetical protein
MLGSSLIYELRLKLEPMHCCIDSSSESCDGPTHQGHCSRAQTCEPSEHQQGLVKDPILVVILGTSQTKTAFWGLII